MTLLLRGYGMGYSLDLRYREGAGDAAWLAGVLGGQRICSSASGQGLYWPCLSFIALISSRAGSLNITGLVP